MEYKYITLQWFAAEDEGRTEDPSELKLKKAREEGRVAKSQDLNGAIVFLLCVLTLLVFARSIFESCVAVLVYFFNHASDAELNYGAIYSFFVETILKCMLPVAVVGVVSGIVSNLVQNKGFIFSLKPISPNFTKIIPKFGEYFKNTLFSFRGFFNILKSLGKVAVIIITAYFFIRADMAELLMSIQNGQVLVAVGKIANMAFQLLIVVAVVFLIFAIPDFFVQKKVFMEEMKMTKYEVKQEYKEMEGDPEVKGHLKAEQKRLLEQNIPKAVKESDVVITNPTHYAVSLKYDMNSDDAPRVTAKGVDEQALMIKQIAKDNDVPQVENRPLARDLYNSVDIDQVIPDTYWTVLAEVYKQIQNFNS